MCPVRAECGAFLHGRVDELPPPKKAAKRKRLELNVAFARRGNTVLLARREEKGLFGGLWELPGSESSLAAVVGARAEVGELMLKLERTLTHRDLVLHVHAATMPAKLGTPPAGYVEWRWVPITELATLGMSSATSEVLRRIVTE